MHPRLRVKILQSRVKDHGAHFDIIIIGVVVYELSNIKFSWEV